MPLTLKEGEYLVRLARRSAESYLLRRSTAVEPPPFESLKENRGAFVTILTYPEKELRGCIGFPRPIMPLYQAVARAAIAAAVEDPRFPPVRLSELADVIFEVSVLSPLEDISSLDRGELPSSIVVGKHGLVVEYGPYSGLLLPQVAVEYGWGPEEFLSQTCLKAGLWPDCWKDKRVRVFRYSSEVFAEVRPLGPIERRALRPGERG